MDNNQLVRAEITTDHPERIMRRLCRHWGHKFPVVMDDRESTITLPLGICRMVCGDVLRVELQGNDEQLPQLQQVVADHLLRMANPEELVIVWHSGTGPSKSEMGSGA